MLTIPVDKMTDGLVKEIGKAIYDQKIKDDLGPEFKGKVVAIDIYSGDYEIGDDDLEATDRLMERRPDAYMWMERVGYPAVHFVSRRPTNSKPAKVRRDD